MTFKCSYFLSEIWEDSWGTICMKKKFCYRYESYIIDDLGNIHMDTSKTGNWHVNFEK